MPASPSPESAAGDFAVLSRTVARAPSAARTGAARPAPAVAVHATGLGAGAAERIAEQWWFPPAFALSFVAVGAVVGYLGWNVEPVSPSPLTRPVATGFAVMFAAAGIFMLLTLLPDALEARRPSPEDDWRRDHPWERTLRRQADEAHGSRLAAWARGIAFAIVLTLLYGLLHLPLVWGSEYIRGSLSVFGAGIEVPGRVPWLVVAGVFDLILLLVLGVAVYTAVQRARFGRPVLHLESFPARPGGALIAELRLPRAALANGPARVTLQCRDAAAGVPGDGRGGPPPAAYEEALELDTAGERVHRLRVAFAVPHDAPGARLRRVPRVAWRLGFRIPVRGPDFHAEFLVPVYDDGHDASPGTP